MMPHDASAAMGTCLPAANTWSSYGIKNTCAPNKCHTMTKTSYIHAHIWSYMYISVYSYSLYFYDFKWFHNFHMISYDFRWFPCCHAKGFQTLRISLGSRFFRPHTLPPSKPIKHSLISGEDFLGMGHGRGGLPMGSRHGIHAGHLGNRTCWWWTWRWTSDPWTSHLSWNFCLRVDGNWWKLGSPLGDV